MSRLRFLTSACNFSCPIFSDTSDSALSETSPAAMRLGGCKSVLFPRLPPGFTHCPVNVCVCSLSFQSLLFGLRLQFPLQCLWHFDLHFLLLFGLIKSAIRNLQPALNYEILSFLLTGSPISAEIFGSKQYTFAAFPPPAVFRQAALLH